MVRMVGDNYTWAVDPEDITALPEHEFCHDCGQIGCTHNVPDAD